MNINTCLTHYPIIPVYAQKFLNIFDNFGRINNKNINKIRTTVTKTKLMGN